MIDLYTAFKLANVANGECVYLKCKAFPDEHEILTGREVRNKYDMRKVKVMRMFPWFCCGDYNGMGFEIALGKK